MSRIRSRNTKPEVALRREVFARGLRYRTSLKLHGKPDIVLTRAKIAVFVDGCFWHGCPEHGTRPKSNIQYWGPKLDRNRARDAQVTAQLEDAGWYVMRIWHHEIVTGCGSVADRIERLWKERR
jgi:DNA mismatch endonuclease (patch repair protein)